MVVVVVQVACVVIVVVGVACVVIVVVGVACMVAVVGVASVEVAVLPSTLKEKKAGMFTIVGNELDKKSTKSYAFGQVYL